MVRRYIYLSRFMVLVLLLSVTGCMRIGLNACYAHARGTGVPTHPCRIIGSALVTAVAIAKLVCCM